MARQLLQHANTPDNPCIDIDRMYTTKENMMAKKNVEELLIAGGTNQALRAKYDCLKTMEDFVALACKDGYDFTAEELKEVLRESGDSFESFGNPPKRMIWWF